MEDFGLQLRQATKNAKKERLDRIQRELDEFFDQMRQALRQAVLDAPEKMRACASKGSHEYQLYSTKIPSHLSSFIYLNPDRQAPAQKSYKQLIMDETRKLKKDGFKIIFSELEKENIVIKILWWSYNEKDSPSGQMWALASEHDQQQRESSKRYLQAKALEKQEQFEKMQETHSDDPLLKELVLQMHNLDKEKLMAEAMNRKNYYNVIDTRIGGYNSMFFEFVKSQLEPIVKEKFGDKVSVSVSYSTEYGEGINVYLKW